MMSFGKPSSLSMSFKKAVLSSDVEEVKQEHRQSIRALVDDYFQNLADGKAVGIRNAKDLAELIKLDLAILGESTEKIELSADEIKLTQVSQSINLDDPELQTMLNNVFASLNKTNDDEHK